VHLEPISEKNAQRVVRLACIGTGFISAIHAENCRNLGTVELTAVYSRHHDSGARFAEKYSIPRVYTDYEELLSDKQIDAVLICLPTPMHREFSIRAAEVGKHILCEKPIALTVEDGEEMIESAEKNNVVLMIAHVLRFWPEYVMAKSKIDEAQTGRIRSVAAYRLSAPPEWSSGNWLLDASQSGGVPVDLMVHDIDFIEWLLGEPRSVKASGALARSNFVESVASVFEYDHAIAYAEAGYILPRSESLRMGFRIVCENGVIEYSNRSHPTLAISREGEPVTYPFVPSLSPYGAQMSYFAECVRNARYPSQCPPRAALSSLAIALQINRSITERLSPSSPRV